MPDLLIELYSEEIPARMQTKAAEDLRRLITDGLVEAGLTYGAAAAFSTPRRLVLTIEGLTAESPDTREERKGPGGNAPMPALQGFLRAFGLSHPTPEALLDTLEPGGSVDIEGTTFELREVKGKPVYFALRAVKGRPAAEIVAEVLESAIRNFPWPKSMRWGSGALRWVRPLHGILCVLTDDTEAKVVPLELDGLVSGDRAWGHRFMAPGAFSVTSFEDYEAKLKRAYVVLRADERAEMIRSEVDTRAFALGLDLVPDDGLLAEVAGLVEWPVVLVGQIEERFLDLPPEVLQTSMKEHQKFFSLRAKTGQITHFATVANIETADNGATILAGNQKVLAARLSDALFFWTNDLRVAEAGMGPWLDRLSNVTFHNKLGSEADRISRIADLARDLAPLVGADADLAEQAARVAKADLASEMVYEFPELQGTMGRYYAARAGLPPEVQGAVAEHYAPLGPSDSVPEAPVSVAVALAEKLDKLTGFWAIDEKPTGSKDPFALRRAALGVIRLVLENGLRLRLGTWVSEDLLAFLHDRLKVHLRAEGVRHDVIDAALAQPGADDLVLLTRRAAAVQAFLATEDGENLVQGFKRASNILAQAEEKDGVSYSYGADVKFAETEEERALFAALDAADGSIDPAMEAEDFTAAMTALAALRPAIDAFFEAVQINADNEVLRRNRLNLLSRIRSLCLRPADLGQLDG